MYRTCCATITETSTSVVLIGFIRRRHPPDIPKVTATTTGWRHPRPIPITQKPEHRTATISRPDDGSRLGQLPPRRALPRRPAGSPINKSRPTTRPAVRGCAVGSRAGSALAIASDSLATSANMQAVVGARLTGCCRDGTCDHCREAPCGLPSAQDLQAAVGAGLTGCRRGATSGPVLLPA